MLVLAFVLTKDVNRHLEETLAAAAAKWAFYSAGYLCVFFFFPCAFSGKSFADQVVVWQANERMLPAFVCCQLCFLFLQLWQYNMSVVFKDCHFRKAVGKWKLSAFPTCRCVASTFCIHRIEARCLLCGEL